MSARTRRKSIRPRKTAKPNNRNLSKFLILVPVAIFLLSLVVALSSIPSDHKISVAYFDEDGASILVLDPKTDSVVKLFIPPDTQLESAYNLGIIKLKNLEKVSQNEDIGSVLLSKTLTKNLSVPVPYYSGRNLNSLFEGSLIRSLIDSIVAKDTNLRLPKRIKLAMFSSRVINSKRISSDLSDYSFVSTNELVDGSEGFVFTRDTPATIASIVSDTRFSNSNYTAKVFANMSGSSLVESVVRTIKNSGIAVTSIEETDDESVCIVKSDNEELLDYYATLFGCEKGSGNKQTDIEFVFGREFGSNF